ncbi:zf-HC2 domain-containing protein [Marinomonas piezotolerans]|uniref:Zf-HC2 domain-containing protein n=1 Tax=Marinomonas piezotolerans TaxID=2213058 RepID=A0A370UC21_9GAMM|nr:zf-HC2 domain-containing protein [Marinomonas piezotolerans]RDL45346.1 zf-HC2 domain-containing protein [Marinomonas piezotolerans]
MIKCKQATQLLSETLDRPLSKKEAFALKVHTAMCPACRQFGKQMHTLRELTQDYMKSDSQSDSQD